MLLLLLLLLCCLLLFLRLRLHSSDACYYYSAAGVVAVLAVVLLLLISLSCEGDAISHVQAPLAVVTARRRCVSYFGVGIGYLAAGEIKGSMQY